MRPSPAIQNQGSTQNARPRQDTRPPAGIHRGKSLLSGGSRSAANWRQGKRFSVKAPPRAGRPG